MPLWNSWMSVCYISFLMNFYGNLKYLFEFIFGQINMTDATMANCCLLCFMLS